MNETPALKIQSNHPPMHEIMHLGKYYIFFDVEESKLESLEKMYKLIFLTIVFFF